MTEYVCEKCGKLWTHKNDYTRHINKKKSCESLVHTLIKKIDELEKKIVKIENKVDKSIITNNTNNTNNTINKIDNKIDNSINITITPIAFGKEDLSFISTDTSNKILSRGFKSIQEFIKIIHFNKDKPEYHNIYLPNWRDKSNILVFDGSKWNLEDKDEILNDLKDKGVAYIQTKYDELDIYDKKNTMIIKKIKRFLESYDEDEKSNILNKDLLLILYNNRELIEKTRKIANK